MTHPNTPTETDIEAVEEDLEWLWLEHSDLHSKDNLPKLRKLFKDFYTTLTHQHTEHAREMLEIVENAANHIINKSKSIENPPEAHSAITHNRGFIYGVEALRDDIKAIAIKKNIKLN